MGWEGRAMAGHGGAIVIAHRDSSGKLVGIRSAMIGEGGLKQGVWYSVDPDGNFKEEGIQPHGEDLNTGEIDEKS